MCACVCVRVCVCVCMCVCVCVYVCVWGQVVFTIKNVLEEKAFVYIPRHACNSVAHSAPHPDQSCLLFGLALEGHPWRGRDLPPPPPFVCWPAASASPLGRRPWLLAQHAADRHTGRRINHQKKHKKRRSLYVASHIFIIKNT